jgi:DHA1 family bicyclomycin/chloramphenicol resistance-like MFS transporter
MDPKFTFPEKTLQTIVLILGSITALGPFSIDMYLPGFPKMAVDLHVSTKDVGLSLTSFFIGISVGQLIYGPLIDRYGRKILIMIGLSLYVAASIGCAFAPSLNWLIFLRLIQALGGCVGMVASRAIVRDVFPVADTARVFSVLMLVMGVAPIIAPTVGGWVVATWGWRMIFFILAGMSLVMLFFVWFRLPESKGPDKTISLRLQEIIAGYIEVLGNKYFLTYTFAGSLAMAAMFAYISGSPFVFMKLYDFTESQYGWVFGANACGLILGSQFNRLALRRWNPSQIAGLTSLIQGLACSLLFIGSILPILPVEGVLVLLFTCMTCLGFTGPNTTALALQSFTHNAGSASALMGALQMITGAVVSAFVSYFHNETILPMVSLMAVCALGGWLMQVGGKALRKR